MINVRHRMFETNSLFVYLLTMTTNEIFTKWKKDELLFDADVKEFITFEEAKERYLDKDKEYNEDEINEILYDNYVCKYDEYFGRYEEYFETFCEKYTTPGGESVVAFGYSGYDC